MAVCLALFALGGCGRKAGDPVPVEGTVTQDGEPVADATVIFVSEDGKGQRATGRTAANGTFKMTTRNTGDGVVPGPYKVTVSKQGGAATEEITDTKGDDYVKKMKDMAMKGKKPGAGKTKGDIHSSYGDEKTTTLKFTIPAEGNKSLEIKLSRTGG
jgi:hypothetical protein